MRNFQYYCDHHQEILAESLGPEVQEGIREISIVVNTTLKNTKMDNGYGINEIKFEPLNQEQAQHGIQVNMEANGTATAINKDHVSRLLQKLMMAVREPLWRKKIFLEIQYHRIEVQEVPFEEAGIKLHFVAVCAAIIFT